MKGFELNWLKIFLVTKVMLKHIYMNKNIYIVTIIYG